MAMISPHSNLFQCFGKAWKNLQVCPLLPILLTIQLLYLLTSRCETVSSAKEGTVSSCLTWSGGRSLEGCFGLSSAAPVLQWKCVKLWKNELRSDFCTECLPWSSFCDFLPRLGVDRMVIHFLYKIPGVDDLDRMPKGEVLKLWRIEHARKRW